MLFIPNICSTALRSRNLESVQCEIAMFSIQCSHSRTLAAAHVSRFLSVAHSFVRNKRIERSPAKTWKFLRKWNVQNWINYAPDTLFCIVHRHFNGYISDAASNRFMREMEVFFYFCFGFLLLLCPAIRFRPMGFCRCVWFFSLFFMSNFNSIGNICMAKIKVKITTMHETVGLMGGGSWNGIFPIVYIFPSEMLNIYFYLTLFSFSIQWWMQQTTGTKPNKWCTQNNAQSWCWRLERWWSN